MLLTMALALDSRATPISRREYEELVRRGALQDARVELLHGRIVSMSPQGELHVSSVTRLVKMLVRALGDRAEVRVQAPFIAPDESEPEPDVAVVPPGAYLDAHPQSALLIVEVSDTSLARDRAKASLYAAAGVPDYWIVNIADDVVEVHREPGVAGYAAVTRHRGDEVVRLVGFGDVEIRVADVLPPARGRT
jgi:Uma2 family endonuclease